MTRWLAALALTLTAACTPSRMPQAAPPGADAPSHRSSTDSVASTGSTVGLMAHGARHEGLMMTQDQTGASASDLERSAP